MIQYVATQMEALVEPLEKVAGTRLDVDRLREVVQLSKQCTLLWKAVLETAANVPSPDHLARRCGSGSGSTRCTTTILCPRGRGARSKRQVPLPLRIEERLGNRPSPRTSQAGQVDEEGVVQGKCADRWPRTRKAGWVWWRSKAVTG